MSVTHARRGGRFAVLVAGVLLLSPHPPADAGEPNAPPRLDAFGDALPDGALARIGTTRLRHGGAITSLVFSPDGRLLASAGMDKAVRLWEVSTGKQHFAGKAASTQIIDFSPDGTTLAAAADVGTIRLWNVKTGKHPPIAVAEEEESHPKVVALRFSPDGTHQTLIDEYGVVTYRAIASGTIQASFKTTSADHRDPQWIVLSADGRIAVVVWRRWGTVLWDVASGKEILTLPDYSGRPALTSDGRYLATGGSDGPIQICELATGELIGTIPSRDSLFAFSPEGRTLATGGGVWPPHDLTLWDVPERTKRRTLGLGQYTVNCLAFSADGRMLATGSDQGVIRLWDVATGTEKLPLCNLEAPSSLVLPPGGKSLAVSSPHGVHSYEMTPGAVPEDVWKIREQRFFKLPGVLALAADGKTAFAADVKSMPASGLRFREAGLWDLDRGTDLYSIQIIGNYAQFSCDNRKLAIDRASVRTAATGETICELPEARGMVYAVAFSHDSNILAFADGPTPAAADRMRPPAADGTFFVTTDAESDFQIRLCDAATGKEFRAFPLPADKDRDPNADGRDLHDPMLGFSPNGRILAAIGGDRGVKLLDSTTGKLRLDLRTDGPFAFSPDGKILATGRRDCCVELWELVTGKRFAELRGHEGPIRSLLFAANGKTLVSASADNTLLLWDVRLQRFGAPPAKLDAAALAQCWQNLGRTDVLDASHALANLAAHPATAVAYLEDRLRPVKAVRSEGISTLIAELDAEDFEVRENANAQLARLGDQVGPELARALKKPVSLEARRRLEQLLAGLHNGEVCVPAGDYLRTLRCIRLLEAIATPQASALLDCLTYGDPQAVETREALAALQRLKR